MGYYSSCVINNECSSLIFIHVKIKDVKSIRCLISVLMYENAYKGIRCMGKVDLVN